MLAAEERDAEVQGVEEFISICGLFLDQARERRGEVAARFEDEEITYGELARRAGQLAGFLRARGVREETVVALSLYHGLDLLVGMMGILLAGAVYLPIDPNYPVERVERLVGDARPRFLITEKALEGKFGSVSTELMLLDQVRDLGEWEATVLPGQAAYVMYTSGSTGRPKGIVHEHRSLAYAALAHRRPPGEKLVALVAGSIGFDASLLVIVLTLVSGGTVCFSQNRSLDAGQIISQIKKFGVNYTLCVPSFYSLLLSREERMPSLKYVDLGGDSISKDILMLHRKWAPQAFLNNVYGPSEYAVGASIANIYHPMSREAKRITVGKPFAETQIFILDEYLKPVARGEKGEICISGPGLARGYLNQGDLTEEKFLWLEDQRCRIYRTGDFGRVGQDGNIEFLGRMDFQVKIRGYRIELGEIEQAIRELDGIDEAIVIVQEKSKGHKQLVAYYSASQAAIDGEGVRACLQKTLPEYMVPQQIVKIDQWPQTPNGKIDREALSREGLCSTLKVSSRKGLTDLERKMLQIWERILEIKNIGVEDNFFVLGGDSLQIVRLQTEIQKQLGIEIKVADLLQYPTISLLTQHVLSIKSGKCEPLAALLNVVKRQKAGFREFRKLRKGA